MSAQRFSAIPPRVSRVGACSDETSPCIRALAARNGGLPCSVLCVVNVSAASVPGKARRATCIAASSALRWKRSNRRPQCIHKQIWPKTPAVAEPACKQEQFRPDLEAPHVLLPCGASIFSQANGRSGACFWSACERHREPGDELDEICLATGAGFLEQPAEMRLDCGVRDAERIRHLRHAADLNNR
jgi:hypothetical protein